jgi:RimJ/RimL family protein N-acetyltransferase
MSPAWTIRTARLVLIPVAWSDLPDLQAIKSDPRVFAIMLGGIRTPTQSSQELADDIASWAARGYGIWTIRDPEANAFLGMTGFNDRPDGRGTALRFALWPETRGRGLAREAAGAALQFGHGQGELGRIVAVAREDNYASRTVLGSIGMREAETFMQNGHTMLLYESIRQRLPIGRPTTDSVGTTNKAPGS